LSDDRLEALRLTPLLLFYGVFAAAGAVMPWYFNVKYMQESGQLLTPQAWVAEGFINADRLHHHRFRDRYRARAGVDGGRGQAAGDALPVVLRGDHVPGGVCNSRVRCSC
jgi:hypothetical protein